MAGIQMPNGATLEIAAAYGPAIPFTALTNANPALSNTKSGGTPYGVSHVSGPRHDQNLSSDEKALCAEQGKRLGETVKKLNP